MRSISASSRSRCLWFVLLLPLLIVLERTASAQVLLAQGGGAMKSVMGWALTLLAIVLGLVVVLRPNKRKVGGDQKKPSPPVKR